MNLPEKYIEDFLVRFTYHSVAIQDDSISIKDTIAILLNKARPIHISSQLFNLIENHRNVLAFMLRKALNQEALTFDILFEIHHSLMNKIHAERGRFKSAENRMNEVDFITASPKETPILMKHWLDHINNQIDSGLDKEKVIRLVSESYITFEHIHPFQAGNELMGRLVNNYILLKEGLAPFIIEYKEKEEYRTLLANQDIEGFAIFAERKIEKEEKRIIAYRNEEQGFGGGET